MVIKAKREALDFSDAAKPLINAPAAPSPSLLSPKDRQHLTFNLDFSSPSTSHLSTVWLISYHRYCVAPIPYEIRLSDRSGFEIPSSSSWDNRLSLLLRSKTCLKGVLCAQINRTLLHRPTEIERGRTRKAQVPTKTNNSSLPDQRHLGPNQSPRRSAQLLQKIRTATSLI